MSDDILTLPPPPADARLAYGSDSNQFLDLRLPSAKEKSKLPYPLVINIHGGFWRAQYNLDHAGHLCAALTSRGLATANLEYRRVGNKGGAWPGTFADIRSAYQFLRQNAQANKLDLSRIVVMGHSAGGQLALCLAAHEPSLSFRSPGSSICNALTRSTSATTPWLSSWAALPAKFPTIIAKPIPWSFPSPKPASG